MLTARTICRHGSSSTPFGAEPLPGRRGCVFHLASTQFVNKSTSEKNRGGRSLRAKVLPHVLISVMTVESEVWKPSQALEKGAASTLISTAVLPALNKVRR
jgi:hypothetical protein